MINLRKYGKPPYVIAAIHGGPGAPGEMAPLARKLSKKFGVLEPMQTAVTLDGQVKELRKIIKDNCGAPVILIGYSWGAFLCHIFTAKNPTLVKKLILVDSGPFEANYASTIMPTRLNRLSKKERVEVQYILKSLESKANNDKLFARFGELMSKADTYKALVHKDEVLKCDAGIFQNVWNTAAKMRESGKLLSLAEKINCPVVAIHGDYDPHPADGVKIPLSRKVKKFKFILLKKCGHTPWIEKYAKDRFYKAVTGEINNA